MGWVDVSYDSYWDVLLVLDLNGSFHPYISTIGCLLPYQIGWLQTNLLTMVAITNPAGHPSSSSSSSSSNSSSSSRSEEPLWFSWFVKNVNKTPLKLDMNHESSSEKWGSDRVMAYYPKNQISPSSQWLFWGPKNTPAFNTGSWTPETIEGSKDS